MAKTTTKRVVKKIEHENGAATSKHIPVQKTYKIYIGGQFPRTESGRYYQLKNSSGSLLANMCLSSRKDFRNAVVAARGAFGGWSSRAAFNRSQILYRIGEMLEGRKAQFIDELMQMGSTRAQAEKEVYASIDRLIYYAGWCDKYTQIFSSVNPVASSHFNFSVPEPSGVVAIIAPDSGLLGLVSFIAPVISGGNTCVVLAPENKALCAISFAEVINSSDVPGGVVNILTGQEKELYLHMASHMDVNSLIYAGSNGKYLTEIKQTAADNVKRVFDYTSKEWNTDKGQSPYFIADFQEWKTTWHPIENIGGSSSKY